MNIEQVIKTAKRIHFIGIGGIGMSGLAAMACHLGFEVTGSDRGADKPENQRIFSVINILTTK